MKTIFVIIRTITWASIFIALVLIYVPAGILSLSGIERPAVVEIHQWIGLITGTLGAVLALWCVVAFTALGRGTPAPFDPPRLLVITGPYRFVRNPMYIGAVIALAGAALFYESLLLLAYSVLFLIITHVFVVFHEEPILTKTFGKDYDTYCRKVGRWGVRWK
ncbi:MAG: isoprenylcysteine carboxylmethyltransferase family protein [Calditrichaeota bacterium]|nr:isoprenylcysteine carboxylmethyltransferase family protein [Calditrichota bacterium]